MATGRTLPKWMKVQVDDGTAMRDIPVNTCSPVGFSFEKIDVSCLQEANKSSLAGQGEVPSVTITGPLDNTAAATASASGEAPALSGSHIVLSAIATPTYCNVARSLAFYQGIQGYWTTGDPVFGGANCWIITAYTADLSNGTYSATFEYKTGTSAPAWGTAAIAA